jgi:hydroxymethylpyrimidine pyrophosphatase-like HAD family hydrolase
MKGIVMRKKYFFFDIDQTLGIGISQIVPPDAQACLDALQAAGHFVALATGRLQCDAAAFADKHGIHSIVADGGNSLTVDGKIIFMEGLPLNPVKKMLHYLTDIHRPWAVVKDNTFYRYSPYSDYPRKDPRNYMITRVAPVDIDALSTVYKVTYAQEPEGEEPSPQFGLPHLDYIDRTYLVEPVDKGLGVERMMERLGADPSDAVVFGDGMNDLTMFRPPFFSIAMGNARPELKKQADYITDPVDQGGVINACRHFGWIK